MKTRANKLYHTFVRDELKFLISLKYSHNVLLCMLYGWTPKGSSFRDNNNIRSIKKKRRKFISNKIFMRKFFLYHCSLEDTVQWRKWLRNTHVSRNTAICTHKKDIQMLGRANESMISSQIMRSCYYYIPWLSIILFKLLVNCLLQRVPLYSLKHDSIFI